MKQGLKTGIYFAIATAVISGFSVFYNKLIIVKGIDPLIFNILKNGGVALVLSLIILSNKQMFMSLEKTLHNDWKKLILIGGIGGSIPFVLFFTGLANTSALSATLIHKTLFVWVALLAIPLLKERLSMLQVGGYLIILYANVFLNGFTPIKFGGSEFFIFAATLLWSIEVILVRLFIKKKSAMIYAWGRMMFGTAILVVLAAFQQKMSLFASIRPDQMLPILGSIVFLTGYVVTFYTALKRAPATIVTAILILSTPITNILTGGFQTHALPQAQLINALLILLGTFFVVYKLFFEKARSLKKQ